MGKENQKIKKIFVNWLPWEKIETASCRLRCYELAPLLNKDKFDIHIDDWDKDNTISYQARKADVVIFQKKYWGGLAQLQLQTFKKLGKKIIFDLSDSEWADQRRVPNLMRMVELADAFICSTPPIFDWLKSKVGSSKPITLILDRLDLNDYPKDEMKVHEDKEVPLIGWIGNHNTLVSLYAIRDLMKQVNDIHKFKLRIICDNHPIINRVKWPIEFEFKEWTLESWKQDLAECDITVNPRITDEATVGKSLNKTVTSWLMGIPCVSYHTNPNWEKELLHLMKSKDNRQENVKKNRSFCEKEYDMKDSVKQFENVIQEVMKNEKEI